MMNAHPIIEEHDHVGIQIHTSARLRQDGREFLDCEYLVIMGAMRTDAQFQFVRVRSLDDLRSLVESLGPAMIDIKGASDAEEASVRAYLPPERPERWYAAVEQSVRASMAAIERMQSGAQNG